MTDTTPTPPNADSGLRIGTAPDSWGVWFPDDPKQVPWQRFLDEVVAAGYSWIELGPYGYLPTDPHQLEDELGTPLFHRTTRRVEPTDAGRTLLLHAGPILASVSAAFQQTQRAGSGELGTLTIAYTPTVAEETLPPLVVMPLLDKVAASAARASRIDCVTSSVLNMSTV